MGEGIGENFKFWIRKGGSNEGGNFDSQPVFAALLLRRFGPARQTNSRLHFTRRRAAPSLDGKRIGDIPQQRSGCSARLFQRGNRGRGGLAIKGDPDK